MDRFVILIRDFVSGLTSADDFEQRYMELWRQFRDTPEHLGIQPTAEQGEILDRLFTDVDAYCGDPKLRGRYDIDADELRAAARKALAELAALEKEKRQL